MKTNEAPEKIWINQTELPKLSGHIDKNSVEYIRKDAFIEKACDYLYFHLDTSKIDVNYKFDFIEEFRNYMKGE